MTKYELTKVVASRTKISQDTCGQVIDTLFDEIKNCLISGDKVVITNLFSLEPYTSAGRKIKNVNTGKIETTKPSIKIRLKASKAFKSDLNPEKE